MENRRSRSLSLGSEECDLVAIDRAVGDRLAGLQLAPLVEFAGTNWRAERDSLEAVLDYALKPRDILQFLLPNFYGNPTHHSYVDVFTMERVSDLRNAAGQSIDYINWSIKNYWKARFTWVYCP